LRRLVGEVGELEDLDCRCAGEAILGSAAAHLAERLEDRGRCARFPELLGDRLQVQDLLQRPAAITHRHHRSSRDDAGDLCRFAIGAKRLRRAKRTVLFDRQAQRADGRRNLRKPGVVDLTSSPA
jgi:hypothetical protein